MGKFLSNIYDHRLPDAKQTHVYSYYAMSAGTEVMDIEWQHHLDWINQNVIGQPQATKWYTVEQLEKMGMIGIYSK